MPDTVADQFQAVQAVADAVLYEGYLLYPYRRSSAKNRVRWQFGVLAPRRWIAAQQIPDPGVAGSSESWWQQVECLAEARPAATLTVRLRFLQLQRRQLFGMDGRPADSLGDDSAGLVSFDEAVPREVSASFVLADLLSGSSEIPVEFPAGRTTETVHDPDGRPLGPGAGRSGRPGAAEDRLRRHPDRGHAGRRSAPPDLLGVPDDPRSSQAARVPGTAQTFAR